MENSTLYACEIKPFEGISHWQTYKELCTGLEKCGGTVEEQQITFGVKTLDWSVVREDGVEVFRRYYVGTADSLKTYADCLEIGWEAELRADGFFTEEEF